MDFPWLKASRVHVHAVGRVVLQGNCSLTSCALVPTALLYYLYSLYLWDGKRSWENSFSSVGNNASAWISPTKAPWSRCCRTITCREVVSSEVFSKFMLGVCALGGGGNGRGCHSVFAYTWCVSESDLAFPHSKASHEPPVQNNVLPKALTCG